ncbi:MAG: putative Zn finger-like uncharacterized protein [Pseudohongiellaceae bacterium]|jgi:predicted Zn finger-like uncharacterized protein
MSSRVTQCPKCQTSFRVTDAQLDIANGAVRCGSCLHIFNALEHWVGEETASITAKATPKPVANPNDSFDDPLDDDDFLIGDDFDTDQLFSEDEPKLSPEFSSEDEPPFQDTPQQSFIEINQNEDLFPEDDLDIDESFDIGESINTAPSEGKTDDGDTPIFEDTATQDSIIEASDGELFSGGEPDIDTTLSDSFLEMDSWEESPTAIFKDLDNINDDVEDNDDAWAEKLLDDDDASDIPPRQDEVDLHPDFLAQAPEDAPTPELDPDLVALLNEAPERDYNIGSHILTNAEMLDELSRDHSDSFNAGDRIGEELDISEFQPLISGIEPEPVELIKAHRERRFSTWVWRLAALLTVLALPYQYISYNYDVLSRDESYRPAFKTLCGFTGCKLPNLHDLGLIKSSNLMVRSHPKASNALVVDAMVTNQAKFQQPFPMLELQFTDIEGKIVAGRRFAPSDYVAGELLGRKLMPAKQPIHISLEIIDPGSAAVNYQLRFLPN